MFTLEKAVSAEEKNAEATNKNTNKISNGR
jgi:hypothetical protein